MFFVLCEVTPNVHAQGRNSGYFLWEGEKLRALLGVGTSCQQIPDLSCHQEHNGLGPVHFTHQLMMTFQMSSLSYDIQNVVTK